jgi:hypothetical protein
MPELAARPSHRPNGQPVKTSIYLDGISAPLFQFVFRCPFTDFLNGRPIPPQVHLA